MPTVIEHKVPFFAPFTGADTIRKQNEYVYTVRATYADEINKIINFWGNLGNTRVTVLHYDDGGQAELRDGGQRAKEVRPHAGVGGDQAQYADHRPEREGRDGLRTRR